MRVLQINTNRSGPTMDLALATVLELGAEILVLSEPNKKAIESRTDWIHDDNLDTAIKVLHPKLVTKGYGKGRSFCFVERPIFTLFGCYASPNKEIQDLEDFLQTIGNKIRAKQEEAILVGDFNAKSPQWGMKMTDRRGVVLTEWIAQHDLVVQNTGRSPTFEKRGYGSILALTIATPGISANIVRWKVIEKESFSDHKYITFKLNEKRTKSPHKSERKLGWNTRKLDQAKLQ